MSGHPLESFTIVPTTPADLPFVFSLFDAAIAYQRRNGYPVWNGYDRGVLEAEMAQGRQYKVVQDGTTACVFSVCYADPCIWGCREQGDAVYLHRIVVNPLLKGQQQFGRVLHWAEAEARRRGLRRVRMDTWADNPTIIAYYQRFGFGYVATVTTAPTPELPVQYHQLTVSLLEYPVTAS